MSYFDSLFYLYLLSIISKNNAATLAYVTICLIDIFLFIHSLFKVLQYSVLGIPHIKHEVRFYLLTHFDILVHLSGFS